MTIFLSRCDLDTLTYNRLTVSAIGRPCLFLPPVPIGYTPLLTTACFPRIPRPPPPPPPHASELGGGGHFVQYMRSLLVPEANYMVSRGNLGLCVWPLSIGLMSEVAAMLPYA